MEFFGDPVWSVKPRGKKQKQNRGLPNDENIRKLAATWIDFQWQLWSKLRSTALMPEHSDMVITRLVEGYKSRFLMGEVA